MIETRKREIRLRAHLEASMGKPVEWGVDDCCAWPAAWVGIERETAVPLPRYASMEQAHALIDDAGGLVNLWDAALGAAGIHQQTLTPEVGDIGIIATGRFGEVGVIFAHGGIAAWRCDSGGYAWITPRAKTLVKAWII